MPTKKNIFLYLSCFAIGLLVGLFLLKYIFPSIETLQNSLKEEKIYQVEHNICPKEDEVIDTQCTIFVDISGALRSPGVYCFDPGDRIIDAVKKAGGFNTNTSLEYVSRSINLSKILVNNQKIYIPSKEELLCELKPFTLKTEEIIPPTTQEDTTVEDTTTDTQTENTTNTENENCININTATITELDSLNGVGLSTAQKIVDSRPYNSINDLLNVSGIGQATFDKFKDNICT